MPTSTPRFALRRKSLGGAPRQLEADDRVARDARSPGERSRQPWLWRLRRALAEDLFVLHYQPIVSLRDRRVSHHEALLRLADEGRGRLVAPGAFLPAAERHGLICEIDRMVLGKAVELMGRTPELSLAVNVSGLSVTRPGMLAQLSRLLAGCEVDPRRLVLELTETSAISDMSRAKAFCAGAQALGCAIALDDFGAGFGSLRYLKHLPFRYLKIDGEFIRGLSDSHTDELVVKALVDLAAGMGGETIAEFVADARTLELVAEHGVDYAQGYELGRPVAEPPLDC